MKNMAFFLVLFFLAATALVSAQTRKVIAFTNGTSIKGRVLDKDSMGRIKVKGLDGNITVYEPQAITSITVDNSENPYNDMNPAKSFPCMLIDKDDIPSKNGLIVNPLGTVLALTIGVVDVELEFQRSLSKFLTLYVVPELAIGLQAGLGLGLGLYVMPMNNYLNGFYFKAGATSVWIPELGTVGFGATCSIGWQFVTLGKFMFQFGIGINYPSALGTVGLSLSIAKMGAAF